MSDDKLPCSHEYRAYESVWGTGVKCKWCGERYGHQRDEALRADPRVREAIREGNEALARGESVVYESGEAFLRDFR
jgi:hypothetical protein